MRPYDHTYVNYIRKRTGLILSLQVGFLFFIYYFWFIAYGLILFAYLGNGIVSLI